MNSSGSAKDRISLMKAFSSSVSADFWQLTFFLCPKSVTAELCAKMRHAVRGNKPLPAKHASAIIIVGPDRFLLLGEVIGAFQQGICTVQCHHVLVWQVRR